MRVVADLKRKTQRSLPVRVCIALPQPLQLMTMRAWLDDACGIGAWAAAPGGVDGAVNDALAFYFADAAAARAFVNRFCCGFMPAIRIGVRCR